MKFLKHLLLTDTFLLRGHINTGDQRLSTFLNTGLKSFLEMKEVTFVNHVQGQCMTAGNVLIRVEEIRLAYEMEASGDEYMRMLAVKEPDEMPVVVQFGGAMAFQVSGKVGKHLIERDVSGPYNFVVMTDPKIQGFTGAESHEHAAWIDLPYVIVNRNRIAFVIH